LPEHQRHRRATPENAEYLLYRAALPVLGRKIKIVQCACALIAGQRDVFASGVRTSSAGFAFPVLNDS